MSHSAIVVAAVSSAASTVGYVIYKDYSRYRRMVDTFATGNMLEPFKVCRKRVCSRLWEGGGSFGSQAVDKCMCMGR